MYRVFVYGTLKKGKHNHTWLQDSLFLGSTALRGYELRIGRLPYVVEADSPNSFVRGEVYECTARILEDLDILEGHPNFYKRELVVTDKGKAWCYIYQDPEFAKQLPTKESF